MGSAGKDGVNVTLLPATSARLIGDSEGASFPPGDQTDTNDHFSFSSSHLHSAISLFKLGSGLVLNATSDLDPAEAQFCFKC